MNLIQFSASPTGLKNTINVDLTEAPYNAAGDGVTNDAQKFTDFGDDYESETLPVTLLLPGNYNMGTSGSVAQFWSSGVDHLRVIGDGRDETELTYTGGSPIRFGGVGYTANTSAMAFIETAPAGQTWVRCLTPAHALRHTVGNMALSACFDTQSAWGSTFGYPTNLHFIDYVRVLGVDGDTGIVLLDRPLRYTHKSTYPQFGDPVMGGPAALFVLPASFNADREIMNLTISQVNPPNPDQQTYADIRSITYRNVGFTGDYGGIPTQNEYWRAIDCHAPDCAMEVDKLIHQFEVTRGTWQNIDNQSAANIMRLTDTTITGNLAGTAKVSVITGGSIGSLTAGPSNHGSAESMTIVGPTTISSVGRGGFIYQGPGDVGVNNTHTMADGIISYRKGAYITNIVASPSGKLRITVASTTGFFTGQTVSIAGVAPVTEPNDHEANGNDRVITVVDGTTIDIPAITFVTAYTTGGRVRNFAPNWAPPETWLYWSGSREWMGSFQVLDVFEDGDDGFVHIETTEIGGFPDLPLASGELNIGVHPCPLWNCTSATGSTDAISLSHASAQNRPLWEVAYREYTDQNVTNVASSDSDDRPRVWGAINFIEFVVEDEYTGVSTLTFNPNPFNNCPVLLPDDTAGTLGSIVINLKIAGTRRWENGSWSGGQTGDTLPSISVGTKFGGQPPAGPALSRNVSSEGNPFLLKVLIDCDQGIS